VTPAPLEIPVDARRPDRMLQMGHTGQITAMAFSPDRQRLVTGSDDSTVRVWDLATGQQQLNLRGDQKIITAVAFSPDGGRLASGSADGKFVVADANTGKAVYSRDFHQWVDAVAFSPDGQYLAVSIQQSEEEEQSSASIHVYRAESGEEFKVLPLTWSSAPLLAITVDDHLISSGFEGGEDPVNIWDIASGQLLKSFPIEAQTISADGRWAVTQEFQQGGKVALWDLKTGHQAWVASSPYGRIQFAFSRDGQQLLLADLNHSEMKLWETASGKEIVTFPGSQSVVRSVVFSGDGKAIAAGAADGSIAIWDATTARRLQFLPAQLAVAGVAFTPDGTLLAGDAQGLVLWDTSAGKVKRISTRPVTNMNASADGNWLAANPDYQLEVWNARSRQPTALSPPSTARTFYAAFGGAQPPAAEIANPALSWSRLSDDPQKRIVWRSFNPLAISPDGKLLATSFMRGGDVAIWDTHSGEKLRTISSGYLGVNCLTFSPDGRWLLTGGQITPFRPGVNLLELRYGIELWDVNNWSERSLPMIVTGGAAAAFSPSGRLLAVGTSAAVITILDLSRGKTVQTLAGSDPFRSGFFVFSPDGKWLAQPGRQGISLWRVAGNH
jgi:WD40 repeat protein